MKGVFDDDGFLVVAGGCDGSVGSAAVGVAEVVVVPESPPAGTGRPPSLASLPHAASRRTPVSTATGRANLRTDDIPSVSSDWTVTTMAGRSAACRSAR